jgi:tRNA-specific 2-thiouridylase
MDMKKKLDQTYMPDKNAKAEKMIVGLSGGLDSYVAAYLLKIQKHDLIGVTILTGWDDYPGDQESVLSCVINNDHLTSIKAFCHQLGIPHVVVKLNSEFKERVVEPWMADRATGVYPNPCWHCHDVRMLAIYDRAKQMGVKKIATGHFAKLFHHDVHNTTFVHSSNDELHDQSALLSRLPQGLLHALELPLSDLQKKEVLRLGENFGLSGTGKKIEIHHCLPWNDIAKEYTLKKIPPRFQKAGQVILVTDNSTVTEHDGIMPHIYGEVIKAKDASNPSDLYLVDYNYQEKKLLVADDSYFKRNRVLLTECIITEETPWSEPVHGGMKISDEVFVDCWIHPKSNAAAFVEWDEKVALKEGEILSVFRKRGKNSKVFLTGKVQFILEEKVPEAAEGEKKHVKVDYTCDY